ncbi:MAG: QueT transporter family protein [Oscillospiraceae bacterium]|nr:QueT transporter family protein [Oscillospiraceae bacterium]
MKMKTKFNVNTITKTAVIAALYVAFTMLVAPFAYGPVQFRLSEALTILPFIMPEAIFGLFIGCIISNILSPYGFLDLICGSLATLLAAYLTYRAKSKWLAPLPPVIVNAVVIGAVITVSMSAGEAFMAAYAYNALTVGAGQLVVCYGLGIPLLLILKKLFIKTGDVND